MLEITERHLQLQESGQRRPWWIDTDSERDAAGMPLRDLLIFTPHHRHGRTSHPTTDDILDFCEYLLSL